MSVIIKRNKEAIVSKIKSWMKYNAIQVCMTQGTVGFENFIQINLVGYLRNTLPKHEIRIESHGKHEADVLIISGGSVYAAIELKVVRLGKGQKGSLGFRKDDGVKITRIKNDISKLKKVAAVERALICVVYEYSDQFERGWGNLVGLKKNITDYRTEVIDAIDASNDYPAPAVSKFGEKRGCVDLFVF